MPVFNNDPQPASPQADMNDEKAQSSDSIGIDYNYKN